MFVLSHRYTHWGHIFWPRPFYSLIGKGDGGAKLEVAARIKRSGGYAHDMEIDYVYNEEPEEKLQVEVCVQDVGQLLLVFRAESPFVSPFYGYLVVVSSVLVSAFIGNRLIYTQARHITADDFAVEDSSQMTRLLEGMLAKKKDEEGRKEL